MGIKKVGFWLLSFTSAVSVLIFLLSFALTDFGRQDYHLATYSLSQRSIHTAAVDGRFGIYYGADMGKLDLDYGCNHFVWSDPEFMVADINTGQFLGQQFAVVGWTLLGLFPLILLILIWVALTAKIWIAKNRTAHGYCPTCGYDLRASPGACPECGKVTENGSLINTS